MMDPQIISVPVGANPLEVSFEGIDMRPPTRLVAPYSHWSCRSLATEPTICVLYPAEDTPPWVARIANPLGFFLRGYAECWAYALGNPPPPDKSVLDHWVRKRVARKRKRRREEGRAEGLGDG